ncbi:MAG: hypothetical protein Q4D65_06760 [Peptostreptococcaceae bacterium]|nr:hypothetical protein [Peptostreptococcaceae bacterium]
MAPYVLRVLNKKAFGNNKKISSVVKTLKKFHQPAGALVAVIAVIHGYLALGTLRLHTGSLVYIAMLITAICGMLFSKKKKKEFLKWHKTFVLVTAGLLALHLLYPSAIYYLLK